MFTWIDRGLAGVFAAGTLCLRSAVSAGTLGASRMLPSWWAGASRSLGKPGAASDPVGAIQDAADCIDVEAIASALFVRGYAVVDDLLGAEAALSIREGIR